jgi:hypothetical protein
MVELVGPDATDFAGNVDVLLSCVPPVLRIFEPFASVVVGVEPQVAAVGAYHWQNLG